MVKWKIIFTKKSVKDSEKYKSANKKLKINAQELINILEIDPYTSPFEKLLGYKFRFSRRINKQHRLVYEINENEKTVKILSMWTHYEK